FLREYEYALRGEGAVLDEGIGFGHRLLYEHRVTTWLRPLAYQVPSPLTPLGFKVALLAVDFRASAAIAHERIGLHQLAMGRRDLPEASFMASLAADASRSEPGLLQGSVLLATGRTEEAFVFIRAGIIRTPFPERRELINTAAGLFYRLGEKGRAQA